MGTNNCVEAQSYRHPKYHLSTLDSWAVEIPSI